MLISILIPNFNKATYLKETLDSIINQSYLNWECIVVDDYSTDYSWDILEEYAEKDRRIKVFLRPDSLPKGGNSCRNYAFSLANGQFIQWFDSDDLMTKTFLENRIKFLSSRDFDFVVFNGQRISQNGQKSFVISPILIYPDFEFGFLNLSPPWLTPSCLYKSDFLEKQNLQWNLNIESFQDIAFNFEALLKAKKIGIDSNEIDWFWIENSDGNNIGNKIYFSPMFRSHAKFIKHLQSYTNIEKRDYVKKTFWEIVNICKRRFGLNLYLKLIFPLFVKKVINFNDFFILSKMLLKKYKFRLLKINKLKFENELDNLIAKKSNEVMIFEKEFGSLTIEKFNSKKEYFEKEFFFTSSWK